MNNKPSFPRDLFIKKIFDAAKVDKDIFIISADFGAPALDLFREELPKQFIHSGISEQHMISMAAGMSLCGKKVYAYAMAPFISLRCFEQIKGSLSLMNQPVTILSVGVGVAYADSGPTHYLTEDIACLRSLNSIEVLTPCDPEASIEMANLTISKPALRYIRLDREQQTPIYSNNFSNSLTQGMCELYRGSKICIITSGYMIGRAIAARELLIESGHNIGVIDLFRIKPIDLESLNLLVKKYAGIVTLEEQGLDGGFGSAVLEALNDQQVKIPLKRMGLPQKYFFENGGRDYILDNNGLSIEDICATVEALI